MILDFPKLPLWATAIFGRIENDSIIAPATAQFPVDKAGCIIGNKPDSRVAHARHIAILERLGNRLFAGVEMCDLGPGSGGMKTGKAGIGKQI